MPAKPEQLAEEFKPKQMEKGKEAFKINLLISKSKELNYVLS